MRFTEGDRVRHKGLTFISGIVMRIVRISEAHQEEDRSYFCKVQLKNGLFYSDRATEWELNTETVPFSSVESNSDTGKHSHSDVG
jgi:hypothetical protein